MSWKRILTLAIAVALGAGAWRAGGWAGLALAASALVLWFLLYYTRLIQVMKRAADRPIGYVGSAVMLNAKLKPRQALLHVIALTQALGERLSPRAPSRRSIAGRTRAALTSPPNSRAAS